MDSRWSFLLALFLFTSCGVGITDQKREAEETVSSPFYVVQFFPASGDVESFPETVTVSLSDVPHRGLLGAITHYNVNCGGGNLAALSVDALTGYSSATVTLPDLSHISPGTSCSFRVSSNIQDLSGNPLGGVRTATYRLMP